MNDETGSSDRQPGEPTASASNSHRDSDQANEHYRAIYEQRMQAYMIRMNGIIDEMEAKYSAKYNLAIAEYKSAAEELMTEYKKGRDQVSKKLSELNSLIAEVKAMRQAPVSHQGTVCGSDPSGVNVIDLGIARLPPGLGIPDESEHFFREALNHAGQCHVSELHDMLEPMPDEQLSGIIGLCGLVSAYTVIDVMGRAWPTDDGLRQIAHVITEEGKDYEQFGVTEQNLHLWLSQCAIRFNAYAEVFVDTFDDPRMFVAAPFFFTANIVARFRPRESRTGDFLDMIENAYESAFAFDPKLLPALMVRDRITRKAQEKA
jgi:hypothetical protein